LECLLCNVNWDEAWRLRSSVGYERRMGRSSGKGIFRTTVP